MINDNFLQTHGTLTINDKWPFSTYQVLEFVEDEADAFQNKLALNLIRSFYFENTHKSVIFVILWHASAPKE